MVGKQRNAEGKVEDKRKSGKRGRGGKEQKRRKMSGLRSL